MFRFHMSIIRFLKRRAELDLGEKRNKTPNKKISKNAKRKGIRIFQVSKSSSWKKDLFFPSRTWSFIRNTCSAAAAAWASWPRVVLRPTSRQQFLAGGRSHRKIMKKHGKSFVCIVIFQETPSCFHHFFLKKMDGHLKLRVRGLPLKQAIDVGPSTGARHFGWRAIAPSLTPSVVVSLAPAAPWCWHRSWRTIPWRRRPVFCVKIPVVHWDIRY